MGRSFLQRRRHVKNLKTNAILATGLALALAACGDAETEVEEVDETAMATTEPATTDEFDPASRDYELSAEAQERRDAFDQDAFEGEYAGYREEIAGESDMADDGADADVDATTTNGDASTMTSDDSMAMGERDPNTNMPPRSAMSFAFLDRDDDGQLSAAEYAIWAVPLDPTQPLPNDETAPYLTAEQINSAADSFFYYDVDGDTHLSEEEFMTARTGGDVMA